jgi:hypothetical protein
MRTVATNPVVFSGVLLYAPIAPHAIFARRFLHFCCVSMNIYSLQKKNSARSQTTAALRRLGLFHLFLFCAKCVTRQKPALHISPSG